MTEAAGQIGEPAHSLLGEPGLERATVLRARELVRRYGSVKALAGLSLEVRAGEIYGFLGRNGAGKTTTIRILMGIIQAESGTVEMLGRTVRKVDVGLKQRIGYVSQEQ